MWTETERIEKRRAEVLVTVQRRPRKRPKNQSRACEEVRNIVIRFVYITYLSRIWFTVVHIPDKSSLF